MIVSCVLSVACVDWLCDVFVVIVVFACFVCLFVVSVLIVACAD